MSIAPSEAPYYTDDQVTLWHGDCLDVLRGLPDGSVDAVVTDPPYGIRFMGQAWDGADIQAGIELRRSQAPMPDDGKSGQNGGYRSASAEAGRYDQSLTGNQAFQTWCTEWTRECLRVLKPGGHLLAFGGSRTWHRLVCAVEDAGFEIRDSIAWLYGSGFPKSLDVSKAIDKAAGAEREVVGANPTSRPISGKASAMYGGAHGHGFTTRDLTAPATPDAERWQGWGTALKPAFEPIVVARKPLAGTVASNVMEHGTGALNIDGCRIASDDDTRRNARGGDNGLNGSGTFRIRERRADEIPQRDGRWPTNVVLDETTAAELDEQTGETTSRAGKPRTGASGDGWGMTATEAEYDDQGGASRYFPVFRYEAKADAAERPRVDGVSHPTVKPLALMRWLVRLVTPPGGTVLEPFAGSGTTIEACVVEGFKCVAIEREAEYLPLIEARIARRTNAARALELADEDLGLLGLLDDTEDGAA